MKSLLMYAVEFSLFLGYLIVGFVICLMLVGAILDFVGYLVSKII